MVFSGYTPSSGIAGPYDSPIFNFLRNLHTVLHSSCTNLYTHQQCKGLPFSLHPLQHSLLVDFFLLITILTGVRWNLVVVLVCISLIMNGVEHPFMFLLAIFTSSLEKCLMSYLPPMFLTALFVFFWYWAAWAVCIFWRYIFLSISVNCFACRYFFSILRVVFFLFMVSFAVQKLFNLIGSHLIIFVFILL